MTETPLYLELAPDGRFVFAEYVEDIPTGFVGVEIQLNAPVGKAGPVVVHSGSADVALSWPTPDRVVVRTPCGSVGVHWNRTIGVDADLPASQVGIRWHHATAVDVQALGAGIDARAHESEKTINGNSVDIEISWNQADIDEDSNEGKT